MRTTFLVFFWVIGLGNCSSSADPSFLTQAIIDGSIDTENNAVVVIYQAPFQCSGTLISKRVVLTAAHCYMEQNSNPAWVIFGARVMDGSPAAATSQVRSVVGVRKAPGYHSIQDIPHDVALLFLDLPAPATVEPILPLPTSYLLSESDLGTELTIVGYGMAYPDDPSCCQRRSTQTFLRWICDQPGGCSIPQDDVTFEISENTFCHDYSHGGSCYGDSGGPALLVREGNLYVAGVSSLGGEDCQLFGCHTRVDVVDEFISSYLLELGRPCLEDLQCLSRNCQHHVCAINSGPVNCQTGDMNAGWLGLWIAGWILARFWKIRAKRKAC